MDVNFNVDLTEITQANRLKNSSKKVAMNETGIDALVNDTMQLAMVINDYLNKIIDLMDSTKETYQCEAADELRRRFAELSTNFPIVIHNIENYGYSLKRAKDNYNNMFYDVEHKLSQATMNVHENIKN